ncbi:MAG: class I SAM-dependent methyltransferase, partial [Actinomycetota bacterium]
MSQRPWIPHEVEFVSDFDRPELATSPWGGHRWFGYDLVRWAKPERIVELGTHYGCSYFAFCQALQDEQSDAELMAIDTWEGEEHSGRYGEEVFEFVTQTTEHRFATVNTRIQRSLFDDALDLVPDGSVDVLHIDGLHTYEAVSHDYATWKDKVAPNGIVLFHDVAPSSGYGSATFWQEVRKTAPGFAFYHSFGLGVLLPHGTDGRNELVAL